jgi:hypothetical protein
MKKATIPGREGKRWQLESVQGPRGWVLAIRKAAETARLSRAEWVRRVTAEAAGYRLPKKGSNRERS